MPFDADQNRATRSVAVRPCRPCRGTVGPQHRSLAEAELFADPLGGWMGCEPGEFVGRKIDHQHDRAVIDLVGGLEQCASDPHLGEWPTNRSPLQPQLLGGDLSHLHQVTDRGPTFHTNSVADVGHRDGAADRPGRPAPRGTLGLYFGSDFECRTSGSVPTDCPRTSRYWPIRDNSSQHVKTRRYLIRAHETAHVGVRRTVLERFVIMRWRVRSSHPAPRSSMCRASQPRTSEPGQFSRWHWTEWSVGEITVFVSAPPQTPCGMRAIVAT